MQQNSLFGGRVGGYPLDPAQCVNIDGPADWERAERLLQAASEDCVPAGGAIKIG
jgi:CMP-N-acetylneuraminic acid synthetase